MLSRVFNLLLCLLIGLFGYVFGVRRYYVLRPLLWLLGVRMAGKCFFQGKITLIYPKNIVLGDRVALGSNTRLAAYDEIRIGDDFLAAPGLTIDTGGHNVISLAPKSAPVVIGNRVWCGINVMICAGVVVGDDVVIGAGSVVTKSIPSNVVAVGVPCSVVKELNRNNDVRVWSAFD